MPAHQARHAAVSEPRYRGRHRAPSTTNRALTIGGVGVGTIAASVIMPSVAHAATAAQWERLAQCESSGNWADNTGNGYYGGLQFAASTWDSYGGQAYAPLASEATPAEQMAIANKVLAAQGWGAWPVCSVREGLAGTSTTSDASAAAPATTTTSTSSSETTSAPATTQATHPVKGANYKVKSGDTLVTIASKHHEHGGWSHLYHVNQPVIGTNPDVIHPGEKLKVQHAGNTHRPATRMSVRRFVSSA